jgi:hypothetical protein
VAKKHLFLEKGVALLSQQTGVGHARKIGVMKKTVTAETHPVGYQLAQTVMDYDYQN